MKMNVYLICAALLAAAPAALANRGPKFLFVSSSTSTSVSTTTSLQSATFTCLLLSKTALTVACSGRRRRSILRNDASQDDSDISIRASKASRDELDLPIEIQGEGKVEASNREGRFAWYYMTTTLTSVSTSTSTSTTYASTVSVSALFCTPSGTFNMCGVSGK